jgi:hypothetical protein
MGRKKKALKTTDDNDITMLKEFEDKVREDTIAAFKKLEEPAREREKFEKYKRLVRSGNSGNITSVIYQSLTNRDVAADIALREYIAELIDSGHDHEMSTQLRFYLVQHLAHSSYIAG